MHESYWAHDDQRPQFPRLAEDLAVDAVVIGGGITGVTTAYLLKQAGVKVALIEKEQVGSGDTYCTTAHLTYVTDTRLSDLVSRFGKDHAQAVWHAGDASILQIHELIEKEGIKCDFNWVPGYWHAPLKPASEKDKNDFPKEAALALELGFKASYVPSVPVVNLPGVMYSEQAQFHPLKYLAGLVSRIPGQGCHVFENSEVTGWEPTSHVQVGDYRVKCSHVIRATHVPKPNEGDYVATNLMQTRLFAFNSYAVGATLPGKSISPVVLWDTSHPYYYLRTASDRDGDYVIFGGEDHRTGQSDSTNQCFEKLEQTLKLVLPEARVKDRWSGQVIETTDGLPYIGEVGQNEFIATGFAGNGMTFGTLAGMMIRDAIVGVSNPWRELFAPSRTSLSGTWNYLVENTSYPYYMLRDRLTRASSREVHELQCGEGCLVKVNNQMVAAYRDEDGQVTELSPVCTHMGCFVHWNSAEKTWDCPCHGSRFLPDGTVHAGPARSPLAAIGKKTVAR